MKRKSLWIMAALMACFCIVLSSCTEDENPPSPDPDPQPLPSVEPLDPVTCSARVDFGDISSLPAELQTALKKRIPNIQSNGGDADISFCKADEVGRYSQKLHSGTTTVVAMPGAASNMNEIIDLAGGVVPKQTELPIMFYGTQKYGQHYVMFDGGIPEGLTTDEKVLFYESRIIPPSSLA